ncbi:MAG: hypothetical protein LWX07_05840 [Bacteroidetes bacterium]|nr:hypothetical protein [Bacteroidota bacterium]
MKKTLAIISLLLISYLFSSCGSLTYIGDSWQKPDYKGRKYGKILVWVLAKESSFSRRIIEDKIVSDLKSAGVTAAPCYDKFSSDILENKQESGEDENANEQKLMNIVKSTGADGVLILSVKDIKKFKSYYQGYYGYPLSGYSIMTYESVFGTGYSVNSDVFFESGLIDLNMNQLVYSVMSETVNPSSVKDFAESFSRKIISTMIEQGVILK